MEQVGVFLDQVRLKAMAGHKIKVAFAKQVVLNPAEHGGVIAFADLRSQYSNREAALRTQAPSEEVGAVPKLAGCVENTVSGIGRDGVRYRCPVHDQRDGGRC